jgi:hypothetical protein
MLILCGTLIAMNAHFLQELPGTNVYPWTCCGCVQAARCPDLYGHDLSVKRLQFTIIKRTRPGLCKRRRANEANGLRPFFGNASRPSSKPRQPVSAVTRSGHQIGVRYALLFSVLTSGRANVRIHSL